MHGLVQSLVHFFYALGGMGEILLGILDSSFLMMPLGNDLLVVALTATSPNRMFYYAVMATIGSTLGVALAHVVSSRMGQKVIEGDRKSKQVAFVEKKIEKYGGIAIGVAALAPPGFPFTPFIVVPAALQYPLKKMAGIIFVSRLIRFLVEGWLARIYGKRLIEMAKSPALQVFVLVLVGIGIVGSAISLIGWIRRGRTRHGREEADMPSKSPATHHPA